MCSFFEIWQKGTKPESRFFLADLPLMLRPLPVPAPLTIFAIESRLHGRYTANHELGVAGPGGTSRRPSGHARRALDGEVDVQDVGRAAYAILSEPRPTGAALCRQRCLDGRHVRVRHVEAADVDAERQIGSARRRHGASPSSCEARAQL